MLRIDLEAVAAGGLRLLQAGGAVERLIVLGRTEGVRGTCELDGDRISLRGFAVERVVLERSGTPLPGGLGELTLSNPGAVQELAVEGVLRLGPRPSFTGAGSLRAVTLDGVRLSSGAFGAELRMSAGQLRYWEEGERRELELATLTVLDVALTLSTATVEVGSVELRELRGHMAPDGALQLECARATLKGVVVRAFGVTARFEVIELRAGFVLGNRALSVRELAVDGVKLEIASLAVLAASRGQNGGGTGLRVPDLPFLDLVDGHVHLDLGLDVAVPVVKKRAARYSTRLDVERGVVDYQAIEKGLAWLEDALIDFELEGDRLILELDPIPLVKFDNKTLVWWKLAGKDLELARKKRVRLRKLLEYRLEADIAARAEQGAGADTLLKLDIDDLDVALTVAGPSELSLPALRLRLGAEGIPALESLRMAGAIHYALRQELEPTQLSAELRGLVLSAVEVSLPAAEVTLGGVELRAVERLNVMFQGFVPGRAELALDHLQVFELEARLSESRAGPVV